MSGAERHVSETGRRPRRRRWLFRAFLVFVLLLLAGFLLLRSRLDAWVEGELTKRLDAELGADFDCADLDVSLWPLGIGFEGLSLDVPAESGSSLKLSAASGRLELGWSDLLRLGPGRVHLDQLRLVEPRLRTDDGSFDFPGDGPADPRSIDLRIGRLEVIGGEWTHEERPIALDFDLNDLGVDAVWSGDRRALLGHARGGLSLLTDPLASPLDVEVATSFRCRPSRIDLFGFQGVGPGLELALDATVGWAEGVRVDGRGTVRADLDRLDGSLEESFPRVGGRASGRFDFSAGEEPFRIEGDFTAGDARFETIRADAVEAHAVYTPGSLVLSGFEAEAFGGVAAGTVRVGLAEPTRVDLDLRGRHLEAPALLDWIDLAIPLSSLVDCRVALNGEARSIATWSGAGEFHTRPANVLADGIRTQGSGTFRMEQGRILVDARDVAAGAALMDMEMAVDRSDSPGEEYLRLEGTTTDARMTQLDTLSILESLGLEAPELVTVPVDGAGPVSSEIGLGGVERVELDLELDRGAWGEVDFDHAGIHIVSSESRLELRRLEVTRGREFVRGSATWGADSSIPVEADVRAQDLDLLVLLPLLGQEYDLAGRISGHLSMGPSSQGTQGSGQITWVDGTLLGEPMDNLTAVVRIDRGMVLFDPLTVSGPAGEAEGSLDWDLESSSGALEVTRGTLRFEALSGLRESGVDLAGTLEVGGRARLSADGAEGAFRVAVQDGKLLGQALGALEGEIRLHSDRAEVSLSAPGEANWRIDGSLGLGGDLPLDARLRLERSLFEPLEDDPRSAWFRLGGELRLQGSLLRPEEIEVAGRLDQGQVYLGAHRLQLAEPLPVSFREGRLVLQPIHLVGPESDLSGSLAYERATDRIEASATGTLDLALVSIVAPDFRGLGRGELMLELGGTIDRPELSGSFRVDKGRLRWLEFPQSLEKLQLDLALEGSRIRIREARGLLGGGEVSAGGEVVVGAGGLDSFGIDLQASNVRVPWPKGFEGVHEARLNLTGDTERTLLSGRVELLRGLYDERYDLRRILGLGAREYSGDDLGSLPADFFFDVNLLADGNVWVRNEVAQFETRFDLQIGGNLQRPELTGRLSVLEGGKIVFRNVQYRIVSGSLDFLDPERVDPYLFLRAETKVGSYEVYLRIEGTLDRFEYELTSNPTLDPPDIIALLTTGQTLQELTARGAGSEASFTGDIAANYFAGALTAPFERQLQKLLGLERVQINPLMARGSADPTTRITVGKRVAERLFVIVATDVGTTERNLYQVEWEATPRHLVTVQQDTLAGIGGEIRYTDRYWWKRRDDELQSEGFTAQPDGSAGRPAAPPVVREIRLLGVSEDERPTLLKRIPLEPGDAYRRAEMFAGIEALRRHFIRRGRIEARVEADPEPVEEVSSRVDLVYRIDTGPRVEILLQGVEGKDERRLRERLEALWAETLFHTDLYADSAVMIRRYFRERGYYVVDVEHESVERGGGRTVTFRIDRGPVVKVSRIVIEGAEALPEERIRRQMLTRTSSIFSRGRLIPDVLEEDLAAIRNLYRDQGHLGIAIPEPRIRLSADGSSAVVHITIEEGPRFTIGGVEVPEGLPVPAHRLLEWSGLTRGEVFSPSRLLKAESGIRSGLDREGYPDARVRGLVDRRESDVSVRFEISAGERKRVGEIVVAGNRLTKEKVIQRELRFKEGDLLSREKLLQAQHRLYRLGVFRNVRIHYAAQPGGEPGLQRVRIQIDEAPPLGLNVGVGYDSEAGLQTSVSTTHDNLGGRVRTVGIQGYLSSILRRVQLVGKDPRLFGWTVPALVDYSVEHREEAGFTIDRRSTAFRVDRRINPRWRGYLRYNWQRQDLSDVTDVVALQEEKLENLLLGDIGLALVRDERDDPLLTTRGTYFTIGARLFNESLLSDSDFWKVRVSGSGVHTFRNGLSFATSARLSLAETYGDTRRIPISERYFAGGHSTLRGFPRDEVGPLEDGRPVGGEVMLLLNQELRFPIWGSLKGVVFYDAGNIYEELEEFDPSDLRHVLGTGARFDTPFGPLRVEYGWKLDRESGESGGEFHLAIGASF